MSGEISPPEGYQENTPKRFTPEEITQITARLKDMPEQEVDTLFSRVNQAIEQEQDQALRTDLQVLGFRIGVRSLPPELIEPAVTKYRERLSRTGVQQPRPIPENKSVAQRARTPQKPDTGR